MDNEILFGATPVIGFRIFALDLSDLTLHSLNSGNVYGKDRFGEAWIPGETKIAHSNRCNGPFHRKRDHGKAPDRNCSCGIWSCKSRKGMNKTYPANTMVAHLFSPAFTYNKLPRRHEVFFSAQIHQWGKVIEHEWGWRSEFARIIPETIQIYPRTIKTTRDKRLVKTLRAKYGMIPTQRS